MIRQPIMVFMGNVDAGKTQLLDTIRNTAITAKEAGGITQAIGASIIPIATIKKICGSLLSPSLNLSIPGILTIDTPGHAAFSNMRKRGGNLADIAVLVIDIREGVKPQTVECIEILKQYKTPFVIALNKLDLLSGWRTNKNTPLLQNLQNQNSQVVGEFEKKLYEAVGSLAEHGLNTERFDRVEDYTKQIAIVPTSATTNEGIPELLMVIAGLSQKFLQEQLTCSEDASAKGTIIEKKVEKGLGTTLDVIIYDGCLKQGDMIVIGALGEPIVSKVKALFEPKPLTEMRDKKAKFTSVKQVKAAIGVKIAAPETDDAVAGMPIQSADPKKIDETIQAIKKEIGEVVLDTDDEGIVVKADSLGSLEALTKLLHENDIPVKKASIGNITKKDIIDAESNYEKDPLTSCLLGFNVIANTDVIVPEKVKLLTNDIIYKLIEDFTQWKEDMQKKIDEEEVQQLTKPSKIKLIKGYVFRQNNPAIVGVDVLGGTLQVGQVLMKNDGAQLTDVKGIQLNKENVRSAERDKQVAVSLTKITVGRQVHEEDVLYSFMSESNFRKLKEFKKHLEPHDIEVLKEIAEIMRKQNPMWGV